MRSSSPPAGRRSRGPSDAVDIIPPAPRQIEVTTWRSPPRRCPSGDVGGTSNAPLRNGSRHRGLALPFDRSDGSPPPHVLRAKAPLPADSDARFVRVNTSVESSSCSSRASTARSSLLPDEKHCWLTRSATDPARATSTRTGFAGASARIVPPPLPWCGETTSALPGDLREDASSCGLNPMSSMRSASSRTGDRLASAWRCPVEWSIKRPGCDDDLRPRRKASTATHAHAADHNARGSDAEPASLSWI